MSTRVHPGSDEKTIIDLQLRNSAPLLGGVLKHCLRITRQTFAITWLTFHELLREKILWSSFLFGLLCVVLTYLVSGLSFMDNARIALSFGLTSIALVGGLISVIMGSTLISKEIQNRTLHLVLTKALWRWQFIVGRFLGLLEVLILNTLLMLTMSIFVFLLWGGKLEISLFKGLILQFVEFGILASVACIFSSFSTSTLAAIMSAGIWIIGHAMEDYQILLVKMHSLWIRPLMVFLGWILPDLTRFDVKAQITHNLALTWNYTLVSTLYGFTYILFALAISCMIFSRRDL